MNNKDLIKNKRNYSISLLRVFAMFSIVLCHFFGWLNVAFLAQFLNFGVYLFLFISGFLYANKEIEPYGHWILVRLKKLLIPYYLFAIPVMIIFYSANSVDIFQIMKYLFCLQGLNFILIGVPYTEIEPLGNLWFITIILICYLITILVKKAEKRFVIKKQTVIIILAVALLLSVILGSLSIPSINLIYFVAYFTGYYISKYPVRNTRKTFCFLGIIMLFASVVIRLITKVYIKESFSETYAMITGVTLFAAAVSFYFIFNYLQSRFKCLVVLAKSKAWMTMDKFSYFVYITHFAFLHSVTSVDNFHVSKFFTILLFLSFTVISTIILYYLNDVIQKHLFKSKANKS